jgi:hypothetical protein
MSVMKKAVIILSLSLFCFTANIENAQAQVPPKAKAFLVICSYGTVGGALLGFATLAFGTSSRAIAQGASLGLYAGIIFGSYVITSHETTKDAPVEEYNPGYPPPEDPYAPGGYGAPVEEEDSSPRGLFDFRYQEQQQDLAIYNGSTVKNAPPPVYFNLIQARF